MKIQQEIIDHNESDLKIDYFNLHKNFNKEFFNEVWIDNHIFMLENHVYNDDFFLFIKNCIDLI